MKRIDGPGAVAGRFVAGNRTTGQAPTVVTADFLNGAQDEIVHAIEAAGLVLDGADGSQLAKALQRGLEYVADTGAASALVVAPTPALTAHVTGQRLRVKIAVTNTGASTVAVSGLAAKAIVTPAGAATSAGDLPAGSIVDLTYNGTAYQMGSWLAPASTTQKGPVQLVSTGVDVTLADQSLALTAAALNTLMPRSHAGGGWQKLPGGLIIQWGSVNTSSAGAAVFTYPIALTTVLFAIAAARSGLVPIYVGSRGVIETTTTTNMAVWGNTMAGAGAVMSIDCLVIGK